MAADVFVLRLKNVLDDALARHQTAYLVSAEALRDAAAAVGPNPDAAARSAFIDASVYPSRPAPICASALRVGAHLRVGGASWAMARAWRASRTTCSRRASWRRAARARVN